MPGAIRSLSQGSGISSSQAGTGTLPATISAGDTVVILIANDDTDTLSLDDFFDITIIGDENGGQTNVNLAAFKAAGTEDGSTFNFTVAGLNDEQFSYVCFSLSGLADPDVTAPEGTATAFTGGGSTNFDPPSETHGAGDVGTYYALACFGADNNAVTTVSTYPSGYVSTGTENPADSGGVFLGWAFKRVSSNVENPGTFVIGSAEQGAAITAMFLEIASGSGVLTGPLGGPFV